MPFSGFVNMSDLSISKGTESTGAHHGPPGCARRAPDTDRETLKCAMTALYPYDRSAEAYFNYTLDPGR